MKRREFIAGLGYAAAWSMAARAQQGVRRVGALLPYAENDAEMKLRYSVFTKALAGLGWTDGRNVRMDLRWAGGDANRIPALAQELVGLQPDIILTEATRRSRSSLPARPSPSSAASSRRSTDRAGTLPASLTPVSRVFSPLHRCCGCRLREPWVKVRLASG
jgi:hypothetical protein